MNKKLSCDFCLLGPPASGKGTIGSFLSHKYLKTIITPGDIYIRLREEDSELGHLVKDALKDGGYCPDYLTNQIISEEANKSAFGIILDGYPRTMTQFEYLTEHFDVKHYIHLDAPYDVLVEAAMNRIQCSVCNKIWSAVFREEDCCSCQERTWKKRFDDDKSIYPKRYENYVELTSPIIESVKDLKNYKKILNFNNPNVFTEIQDWVKLSNQNI